MSVYSQLPPFFYSAANKLTAHSCRVGKQRLGLAKVVIRVVLAKAGNGHGAQILVEGRCRLDFSKNERNMCCPCSLGRRCILIHNRLTLTTTDLTKCNSGMSWRSTSLKTSMKRHTVIRAERGPTQASSGNRQLGHVCGAGTYASQIGMIRSPPAARPVRKLQRGARNVLLRTLIVLSFVAASCAYACEDRGMCLQNS